MHAWLDFVTELQKYTSFTYSWSTSEKCKNLDAVMPDQLLAANTDAVAYQMEEYKNPDLFVIGTAFNTTTTWRFYYYMYWLGKTTR